MAEGPVLIHVWEVDPTEESSNLQRLEELFAHQIATDPGFVSARVFVSEDRLSIAATIEMRSVEDRQRIEQLPEVRETLDHLHGAANLVLRLYDQVKVYNA
jgi:hypothetical protein